MRFSPWLAKTLALSIFLGIALPVMAGEPNGERPDNVGRGLRPWLEPGTRRGIPPLFTQGSTQNSQPLVKIRLNGERSLTVVQDDLIRVGMQITARTELEGGILEGYLPGDKIRAVAKVKGVHSVLPLYKPYRQIGQATSQGRVVQLVDKVQPLPDGITYMEGQGIKIGVISDSFSTAPNTLTTAVTDVTSGDLPGVGNPNGHTTPVTVLADLAVGEGSDEGRAMLQIIHDLAPKATLGFTTGFLGSVDFAQKILDLRQVFGADVIVDDLTYFDEPIFSDGIITQAVDQVTKAGTAYFSSAGNQGRNAYAADFQGVDRKQALQRLNLGLENIQIGPIIQSDRVKGFHDFDPGPGIDISQGFRVNSSEVILSFQWDEYFGSGRVKTDYDLLVFDQAGIYLGDLSGTDRNVATGEALELLNLPTGEYQLVIAKLNRGSANRLKYIVFGGVDFTADYFPGASTIFGHAAAKNAQAVAAAFYATAFTVENFSSVGPTKIFFDSQGKRLRTPEVRNTPQLTGVDGVDTTFFGVDTDSNGFPNFYGTSASAPHAAAIAALVLEAAGGRGSLAPQTLYSILQASAEDLPYDADPDFSKALLTAEANRSLPQVGVTAQGRDSSDPNFFKIEVVSLAPGDSITQVVFDLSAAGLVFDTQGIASDPYIFGNLVGIEQTDITVKVMDGAPICILEFAPNTFNRGDSISFGIDRDVATRSEPITVSTTGTVDPGRGNSADELAGAAVNGKLITGTANDGVFFNEPGPPGPDSYTGAGLINALEGVQKVFP